MDAFIVGRFFPMHLEVTAFSIWILVLVFVYTGIRVPGHKKIYSTLKHINIYIII